MRNPKDYLSTLALENDGAVFDSNKLTEGGRGGGGGRNNNRRMVAKRAARGRFVHDNDAILRAAKSLPRIEHGEA